MSAQNQPSQILLVEDDPAVRRVCRLILERAGYKVLEADSAPAAQLLWDTHAPGIDLLVTDYKMPGLTGLQLSAWLRNSKPGLKILLLSGDLKELVPESIAFLPKPFSPSNLTEAVIHCLHS